MSDLSKYQRSRRLIQETIDALKSQLMFATYLNDGGQVSRLTGQIEKLMNTLKVIDSNLAKLRADVHTETV